MTETTPQVLEGSFQIAWDYLDATGELGDPEPAAVFLLDTIEAMMRRGERRKLLLSNRAIDAQALASGAEVPRRMTSFCDQCRLLSPCR
jgi:hypothetical protein